MSMIIEKRDSHRLKSILSILRTNYVYPKSKLLSNQCKISSLVLIIICMISIWATVSYFILGLGYYFNAAVLLRDLNFVQLNKRNNVKLFTQEIYQQFYQLSLQCFYSLVIYLIFLFICLFFLRYRQKQKQSEILLPRSEIIKPQGTCNKRWQ